MNSTANECTATAIAVFQAVNIALVHMILMIFPATCMRTAFLLVEATICHRFNRWSEAEGHSNRNHCTQRLHQHNQSLFQWNGLTMPIQCMMQFSLTTVMWQCS